MSVIVITHSTAHLDLASHLLAIAAVFDDHERKPSRVGYFGPPDQLYAAFEASSAADVMDALRDGVIRYDTPAAAGTLKTPPSSPKPSEAISVDRMSAFSVNLRREMLRMRKQLPYWVTIAILAPLIVGVIACVAADARTSNLQGSSPLLTPSAIGIVVMLLAFFGTMLSTVTTVQDWPVLSREQRWGLDIRAAMAARWLVRLPLACVQAFMTTTVIAIWRTDTAEVLLHPAPLWIFLILCGLTVSGLSIGLLIGIATTSTLNAVWLMVLALAVMVTFSGGVIPLHDLPFMDVMSRAVPTRWAVAGLISELINRGPGAAAPEDSIATSDTAHYLTSLSMLFVLTLVTLVFSWLLVPRSLQRSRRR